MDASEQQETESALNNAEDFLEFNEESILDETSREYVKFGFNKMAKKNNFILLEEMGDAFRHAGQNPSEDIIKDMMEKAKAAKRTKPNEVQDDTEPMDRLTYQEYLSVVHEYWYPPDEDRQHLEEAFDTLDPKRTAKLMLDDFTNLLKNCDWPDEEIELLLSQVMCADGYFLYDDLTKLLLSPVELPKKKSAKPKSSSKKKTSA